MGLSVSDKRQIHTTIKRLTVLKTWQLLVLLVLSLFVSATFLRLNNTGMIERRNAIAGADKAGNTQDISSRIYDIQRYAASHMNADTGVFYLQHTYNLDVRKAMAASDGASSTGDNSPQAKADAVCNPNLQIHGYSKEYQDCMLRELSKTGQVIDPATVSLPDPALYRYSFASPMWSPDFAGFSVLVSLLIALIIVGRLVVLVTLRILLKWHYRRV